MKVSLFRKFLAVIAFWALAVFGGVLVLLWNALAPYYSQYRPGDLGYEILVIVATPIGVVMASAAVNAITKGKAQGLCLVNCVIAATLFSALTLYNAILGNIGIGNAISMLLAISVAIYSAHAALQSIVQDANEECDRLRKQIEQDKPVVDLFCRFAEQAGMTVPEYTDHILNEVKKAVGETESE